MFLVQFQSRNTLILKATNIYESNSSVTGHILFSLCMVSKLIMVISLSFNGYSCVLKFTGPLVTLNLFFFLVHVNALEHRRICIHFVAYGSTSKWLRAPEQTHPWKCLSTSFSFYFPKQVGQAGCHHEQNAFYFLLLVFSSFWSWFMLP